MYQVISSRQIYKGGVISLVRDDVRYESGALGVREVIHHPGAVGVAGITDSGEVPLVLQYRHPSKSKILEIPAGLLEPNQDPLDCAKRELKEEVGGVADGYVDAGWFYTTPGCSDERFYLFLAQGVTIGETELEDGELIEPMLVDLEEAIEMISRGDIVDSKTIVGLLRLRDYMSLTEEIH